MSCIAVVSPRSVPAVEGGNERHWRTLAAALRAAGHTVDLVELDSPESTLAEVLSSYRRFVQLDLDDYDVVISGKYPSFMVNHRRHIRHLNHLLRGLYDRYDESLGRTLPESLGREISARADDPSALLDWAEARVEANPDHPLHCFPGPFSRAVVHALDLCGRRDLAAEAAVSEVVALRNDYVDPERPVAIVPPLGDLVDHDDSTTEIVPTTAHPTTAHPTTVCPVTFVSFGRLDAIKRFDLIIRAFASARLPGAELIISGEGPQAGSLQALADRTPGVRMVGRLSDQELRATIAAARAVVLAPIDEDFGLVAAEAMALGCPVITTTDSGGIAEQVEHETSGLIAAPHVLTLGRAIRRAGRDHQGMEAMGRNGRDTVAQRTWQPMLQLVDQMSNEQRKPRLLILSTFAAEPVRHGGHKRLRGLATALTAEFDVVVLALVNTHSGSRRRRLTGGVEQLTIGRSGAHLRADFRLKALLDTPVDDIACHLLWPASPTYADALAGELDRADVVMLAHPYLVTSLPDDLAVPLIYDAHNVEQDLKSATLEGRPGASRLLQAVLEAETAAIDRAGLISFTSASDGIRLSQLGAAQTIEATNGIDASTPRTEVERLQARRRFFEDQGVADRSLPVAVFMGSNHVPNREAASRICTWASQVPSVHFVIAGGVEIPNSATSGANLTLVGPFASGAERRLLAMADVALNPVASGSGTNLKVLDALAIGVPVLTTDVGARGIDDVSGVHVCPIDDFVERLAEMADGHPLPPPTPDELARFSWPQIAQPLATAIRQRLPLFPKSEPAPYDPSRD